MGVRLSKQIAELVIATCQQVNDDGRIDDMLLKDEAFRRQLARLSKEIPISLRNIIITKKYRERKDYGGKEITEHRAFKALWNASDPELKPIIQSSLLEWYENPESFVNKKSKTLPEVHSISSYLSVLYHLQESQQIDRVYWRLFLIPLSNVFETLGRSWGWRTTIDTDLISLLSNAGLIAEDEKYLCQHIPSWHSKSKRYRILAEDVGYGGLCCLPDDISNLLWEKDLPSKGEVHDACINLLIDHQIKEAASANVTGNDDNFITADTAAETVVNSLCEKFKFLSCNPREPSTERSHASNLGSRASHVQDGIPSSGSGLISNDMAAAQILNGMAQGGLANDGGEPRNRSKRQRQDDDITSMNRHGVRPMRTRTTPIATQTLGVSSGSRSLHSRHESSEAITDFVAGQSLNLMPQDTQAIDGTIHDVFLVNRPSFATSLNEIDNNTTQTGHQFNLTESDGPRATTDRVRLPATHSLSSSQDVPAVDTSGTRDELLTGFFYNELTTSVTSEEFASDTNATANSAADQTNQLSSDGFRNGSLPNSSREGGQGSPLFMPQDGLATRNPGSSIQLFEHQPRNESTRSIAQDTIIRDHHCSPRSGQMAQIASTGEVTRNGGAKSISFQHQTIPTSTHELRVEESLSAANSSSLPESSHDMPGTEMPDELHNTPNQPGNLPSNPGLSGNRSNDQVPPELGEHPNWQNFESFNFDQDFVDEVLAGFEDFYFPPSDKP